MKTTKYTLSLLLMFTILLVSCEDYLDKVEDVDSIDESEIFTDINLAEKFLDAGYAFLVTEISDKGSHSDILSGMVMSGEGYPGRFNNRTQERAKSYFNGDYSFLMNLVDLGPRSDSPEVQRPKFVTRYAECWKGIRQMNTFLENVDLIDSDDQERIDGMIGQAYFIKVFEYHLLTKRHGGLPYFTTNLDINEDLGVKRESYESNVQNMLLEIDEAIRLLPKQWTGVFTGRPTKGAAMALKSRIALFAASPLANPENDQQKWEFAAEAASDLINYSDTTGLYKLIQAPEANTIDVDTDGADLFAAEPDKLLNYRSIFVGPGQSKTLPQEVIFMEVNDAVIGAQNLTPLPRTYLTSGFDIVKGNFNPQAVGATANIMAKFEMKNGLPIDQADSNYNEENPFINRDPRFYNSILYNGVPWTVTTSGALNTSGAADLAVVNENNVLGLDIHNPATPSTLLWQTKNITGLRIRKWVPDGLFLRSGQNAQEDFHVNSIIFRMSEIYLNYAEAANEAFGPTGSAPNQTLTSLDAVNKIRNRVGMPDVNNRYSSNQDGLRDRIRNERAVELCFEASRYDDIRRWRIAHLPENKKIEFLEMRWQGGKSALFPTGFDFEVVEQTDKAITFDEKHYWWPVPSTENEIAPAFEQTINW